MKNTLAIKILRGSLFLVIALFVSFVPRLLDLSPQQDAWVGIATTLALFMQGVVWANIIIGYYLQRYVHVHATEGANITTYKALGALARVTIWIILGIFALSTRGIQIRTLLTGLGIGGLAVALAVQNILGDLLAAIAIPTDKPFVIGAHTPEENYT